MKSSSSSVTIMEKLGSQYSDFAYFCIINLNKDLISQLCLNDFFRYQRTRKCKDEYIVAIIKKLGDDAELLIRDTNVDRNTMQAAGTMVPTKTSTKSKKLNKQPTKKIKDSDVLKNLKTYEPKRKNGIIKDETLAKIVKEYPHQYDFVLAAEKIAELHSKNIDKFVNDAIDGDSNAKMRLAEICMCEVLKTAYECSQKYNIDFDDAFQEGITAVIEGAERYNSTLYGSFIIYSKERAKAVIVSNNVINRIKSDYEEEYLYSTDELEIEWKEKFERRKYALYYDEFLSELSPEERIAIEMRYGIYGEKHTLEEIGNALKLSQERVRQIINKALIKINRCSRNLAKNKKHTRRKQSNKVTAQEDNISMKIIELQKSCKSHIVNNNLGNKYATLYEKRRFLEYLYEMYSPAVASKIYESIIQLERIMIQDEVVDQCFVNRKDLAYLQQLGDILIDNYTDRKDYHATFFQWLNLWMLFLDKKNED